LIFFTFSCQRDVMSDMHEILRWRPKTEIIFLILMSFCNWEG
jgi:hypothetical protein